MKRKVRDDNRGPGCGTESYIRTEFAIVNDFTIIKMYVRECEFLCYDWLISI